MPERIGSRTVATEDVQGPGSWVQIRPATVGEILARQREVEQRDNVWYKIGVFLGRVVGALGLRKRETSSDRTSIFAYWAIDYVKAWNWVNGDGEPLPSPEDDPSVVERLTQDELTAIVEAIHGQRKSEEQKN